VIGSTDPRLSADVLMTELAAFSSQERTLAMPTPSKFERMVAKYRVDHQNPINHVLHVYVGWPLVAAAVVCLPFRPWWSLGCFLAGYAIMFAGHFLFERNLPTILKHPSTPFVMAWSVIRELGGGLRKLAAAGRAR
jgi:hypothetical protein